MDSIKHPVITYAYSVFVGRTFEFFATCRSWIISQRIYFLFDRNYCIIRQQKKFFSGFILKNYNVHFSPLCYFPDNFLRISFLTSAHAIFSSLALSLIETLSSISSNCSSRVWYSFKPSTTNGFSPFTSIVYKLVFIDFFVKKNKKYNNF